MDITCCSICYITHKWPGMLDRVAADGWKNVELVAIPGWIHVDLTDISGRAIADEMNRRGLTLRAIHAGAFAATDNAASAAMQVYCRQAVDVLAEAGADQLVFTGGGRETESLDDLVSAVEELARYAEGTSVKVGLENHYRNRIETIEDYDYVLSRVEHPQIGVTADLGHFNSSKVDTAALLRKHADRLVHVHVKDHLGTVSMPLGQGEVDIPGTLRVLGEIGYDRSLSVELEVEDLENLDRYAAEALTYLTAAAEKAGVL